MKDDVKFYIKFIKEIEKHRCLYDHNDDDYNSKSSIKDAWNEIAKLFGENDAACKSKWRSIRSSYIRWKTAKLTSEPGSGPKKEYYLAPYLHFIDPFVKTTTVFNITSPFEISEESIEFCNLAETALADADEQSTNYEHPEQKLFEQDNFYYNNDQQGSRRKSTDSDSGLRKKRKHEDCLKQRDPKELYLLSLFPHLKSMSEREYLHFQRGVADLIDKIKYPIKEMEKEEKVETS